MRAMTKSTRIQTENKSLQDVESKDNPTGEVEATPSLDQPTPTPADVAEVADGVEVTFIHHFDKYVPGQTATVSKHLAGQLVATKRASYAAKDED